MRFRDHCYTKIYAPGLKAHAQCPNSETSQSKALALYEPCAYGDVKNK